MIKVICTNWVPKENADAFIEYANAHAKLSKSIDHGCVDFEISKYNERTNTVVFNETWKNQECLDLHSIRSKSSDTIAKLNTLRIKKSMDIINM